MNDPLKPSVPLLCKLGSILVHMEEANSKKGHSYDYIALKQLMDDAEVKDWLRGMDRLSMLPVKR